MQTLVTGEQYGLAFQKNADALRDAVNGELDKMKKDGTYADIYRKWLDSDPPKSILQAGQHGIECSGHRARSNRSTGLRSQACNQPKLGRGPPPGPAWLRRLDYSARYSPV